MNDGSAPVAIEVLVVERYWPSVTTEAYLSNVGTALADTGLLASIVIAEDDRVLSLVIGGTVDDVETANRARGLPFIRVLPATVLFSPATATRLSQSTEAPKS